MSYTFSEFKKDIQQRRFQEKSRYYRRLLEVVGPYLPEEEELVFYPKNLYNSKDEEFFFLNKKSFISVTLQPEKSYSMKIIKEEVKEFHVDIPEYNTEGVILSVRFSNGESIRFHSLEDSNDRWNDEYIGLIQDVYKHLTMF